MKGERDGGNTIRDNIVYTKLSHNFCGELAYTDFM